MYIPLRIIYLNPPTRHIPIRGGGSGEDLPPPLTQVLIQSKKLVLTTVTALTGIGKRNLRRYFGCILMVFWSHTATPVFHERVNIKTPLEGSCLESSLAIVL